MRFPVKAWLPFCIRPSEAVLQRLANRRYRSLRRRGRTHQQAKYEHVLDDGELRQRFNLPEETYRARFSHEQWYCFRILNGWRVTWSAARNLASHLPQAHA